MSENALGKAASGSDTNGKDVSPECPTCGRTFQDVTGMRWHHSYEHNESIRLIETECCVCDENIEKEPHHYENTTKDYCSKDCQSNDLRQEKTISCLNCGENATFSPPSEAGKYCDTQCEKEHRRGENHPQFKDRHDYYGDQWTKQRRKARKRDDYECQICGKSKNELGKHPPVHHIIPVREFSDPNDAHYLQNLITLCPKHHGEWEGIPLRPQ